MKDDKDKVKLKSFSLKELILGISLVIIVGNNVEIWIVIYDF